MITSPLQHFYTTLASAPVTVSIDWVEQLAKGGWIIWIQGALVVTLGAIVIERFLALRQKHFLPAGMPAKVLASSRERNGEAIHELCEKNQSAYSECLKFAMDHGESDPGDLSNGIRDIATGRIDAEYEKLAGLSLIAATAPLLGLLGTMIGMIESFQLVALFGDEGGASLLADSIAKALITTAVGLIIALPALFMHHFFKRRIQDISRKLEKALTEIHREWFLRKPDQQPSAAASAERHAENPLEASQISQDYATSN